MVEHRLPEEVSSLLASRHEVPDIPGLGLQLTRLAKRCRCVKVERVERVERAIVQAAGPCRARRIMRHIEGLIWVVPMPRNRAMDRTAEAGRRYMAGPEQACACKVCHRYLALAARATLAGEAVLPRTPPLLQRVSAGRVRSVRWGQYGLSESVKV